jgi:O-antigen/teichoic acid export membrane protein
VQHPGWLARGFLAVVAGNYGALVLSLAINIVLTRRLGTEEFGRLSLLFMVSQVMMLFASNWTYTGFIRFAAQEFTASGTVAKTFWTRGGIVAPLALVSCSAALLAGEPLARYLDIPRWALWLVIGHFLAFHVMTSLGAVFQARQEMGRYGILIFADKALVFGILLLLPFMVGPTPLVVLGTYAISCLTVSVMSFWVLGCQNLRPINFHGESIRSLLRFSLPLTLSIWAGLFGTNWIDLIIIKGVLSVSDVGLYSLASQLSGVVQQLTIIFSTLLLPQLSAMVLNEDHAAIRSYLRRMVPYWLLGTSILFCLVLLGADPLLPLVFGRSFQGAVTPFAVLMIATAALALFNAFDPLLNAYGATWALMRVTVVSVIVKVALTFWLTPLLGITGAALATVASYLTSAVLVMVLIRRQTGTPVLSMIWLMAPVLVVCVARLFLVGPVFYLVAVLGTLLSVFALVQTFRLFDATDRGAFKELWLAAVHGSRKMILDPSGPGRL